MPTDSMMCSEDNEVCDQELLNSNLKIVALDFYDGATEGFVRSLVGHGPCYFKILAWDEAQDQRLFALTRIEKAIVQELVRILASQEDMPNSTVWLPKWKFHKVGEEEKANDIVSSCQERLRSSGFLILGSAITDSSAKQIEFDDQIAMHVSQILDAPQPDKLANWLSYFN